MGLIDVVSRDLMVHHFPADAVVVLVYFPLFEQFGTNFTSVSGTVVLISG